LLLWLWLCMVIQFISYSMLDDLMDTILAINLIAKQLLDDLI